MWYLGLHRGEFDFENQRFSFIIGRVVALFRLKMVIIELVVTSRLIYGWNLLKFAVKVYIDDDLDEFKNQKI